MRVYTNERVTYPVRYSPLATPIEFQHRPKTRFIWNQLKIAVQGLKFVKLSEESDTLLICAPTISDLVITMMKVKAILLTKGLDDYVSIGHF